MDADAAAGRAMFPDRQYFESVVDASPFFRRMTPADLSARGDAPSAEAYARRYKAAAAASAFTPGERGQLRALVARADALLAPYPRLRDRTPWRFVKTCGVENDWPHTLDDVIVVPCGFLSDSGGDDGRRLEVLVHEKLHVFQRLHPEATAALVAGAWRWAKKRRLLEDVPGRRNNPDLDAHAYGPEGAGWYVADVYDRDAPTDIAQVRTVRLPDRTPVRRAADLRLGLPDTLSQLEHPYEVMAELVPQILLRGARHAPTEAWMATWL